MLILTAQPQSRSSIAVPDWSIHEQLCFMNKELTNKQHCVHDTITNIWHASAWVNLTCTLHGASTAWTRERRNYSLSLVEFNEAVHQPVLDIFHVQCISAPLLYPIHLLLAQLPGSLPRDLIVWKLKLLRFFTGLYLPLLLLFKED